MIDDRPNELINIAIGIVCLSVCAPKSMTMEQVEVLANINVPTGISSRWSKSGDETFATGQANGCDCEIFPDTRRHWLLNC